MMNRRWLTANECHNAAREGGESGKPAPSFTFLRLALKASVSFNLLPVSSVTPHMFKRRREREGLWI